MTAPIATDNPAPAPDGEMPSVASPSTARASLLEDLKSFIDRQFDRGITIAFPPRVRAVQPRAGRVSASLSPQRLPSKGSDDQAARSLHGSVTQLTFSVSVVNELTSAFLADAGLASAQRRTLKHLKVCSETVQLQLQHLVDLAQPHGEPLVACVSRVRLRDVLWNVVGMVQPLAVHRGIDVHLQLSPSVPIEIQTDERRLRQVLLCLMSGVIQASTHGPVKLSVRRTDDLLIVGPAVMTLEFTVHDQGAELAPSPEPPMLDVDGIVMACQSVAALLGGRILVEEGTSTPKLKFQVDLPMPWMDSAA